MLISVAVPLLPGLIGTEISRIHVSTQFCVYFYKHVKKDEVILRPLIPVHHHRVYSFSLSIFVLHTSLTVRYLAPSVTIYLFAQPKNTQKLVSELLTQTSAKYKPTS